LNRANSGSGGIETSGITMFIKGGPTGHDYSCTDIDRNSTRCDNGADDVAQSGVGAGRTQCHAACPPAGGRGAIDAREAAGGGLGSGSSGACSANVVA